MAKPTNGKATATQKPAKKKATRKKVTSPAHAGLDFSSARAKPVQVGQFDTCALWLIGCGGSGSWLAPAVARTARQLKERGVTVQVTFVDKDIIEPITVARQNFCDAEIDSNKALALAARFSQAWGLEIRALPDWFQAGTALGCSSRAYRRGADLTVLIGCVDNAAGRKAIHAKLDQVYRRSDSQPASLWWLDCGNSATNGQVLLGSTVDRASLQRAFPLADRCGRLPAPSLWISRAGCRPAVNGWR